MALEQDPGMAAARAVGEKKALKTQEQKREIKNATTPQIESEKLRLESADIEAEQAKIDAPGAAAYAEMGPGALRRAERTASDAIEIHGKKAARLRARIAAMEGNVSPEQEAAAALNRADAVLRAAQIAFDGGAATKAECLALRDERDVALLQGSYRRAQLELARVAARSAHAAGADADRLLRLDREAEEQTAAVAKAARSSSRPDDMMELAETQGKRLDSERLALCWQHEQRELAAHEAFVAGPRPGSEQEAFAKLNHHFAIHPLEPCSVADLRAAFDRRRLASELRTMTPAQQAAAMAEG